MNEETSFAFHPSTLTTAFYRGLQKLNPFVLWHNPVIFLTEIGAILTTIDTFVMHGSIEPFTVHITIWLWITVIFANTAESLAEIRNEARTMTLRQARSEILASRYDQDGNLNVVSYKELRKGDLILVRKGETIPADGEIISGSASIDESSVTGESQLMVRHALSATSNVTAGTKVVSDQIVIKVTANPGEGFLDRMIDLVEGTKRKKTHNEIALTILLSSLSAIFLVMVLSFQLFAGYYGVQLNVTMQIALLTCLIPTTIASLLNAIGIAGINKLMKKNVIAMSGQAVEVAGDVDLILLDKTGTITYGVREAAAITPAFGIPEEEFARGCYLSSFFDETKEGKSIVVYVKERFPFVCVRPRIKYNFFPFSVHTRLSGIDLGEEQFRKGAVDAIELFLERRIPDDILRLVRNFAEIGDTPLIVADQNRVLGVIALRDRVKPGLSTQFAEFKLMGIKTVMITGDNPLTAEAVSKEVQADDFIASANPEQKLHYLRQRQLEGKVIAMTGDGINDAPALAQADLGVAMNEGMQAAKEAANMIDLDSHPNKLFEIIQIGKQLLMTRGALTAFSISTDLAKYFVMLPALLIPALPGYKIFNFLNLSSPKNAILSAVIFNAISLVGLIPLAFKGVKLVPHQISKVLAKHLLIYGLGGIILPLIGIKLIDMFLVFISITE